MIEKVALELVHTTRRLRHYFKSHQIIVKIDCPISNVLRKLKLDGRIIAFSVELS